MSLTLYRLNVVPDPDGQLQDLLEELIDNSVLTEADLVEILPTIGAYEFKVEEDDIWGEPGTYLVLKVEP